MKKGNQWYFGFKGHIGVDRDTGLVNKIKTTAANVHDTAPVPDLQKARAAGHDKSSIRSKVEHVFAVIQGMFRYRKTRLRGLPKVDAQLHMLFALANLILADRPSVTA